MVSTCYYIPPKSNFKILDEPDSLDTESITENDQVSPCAIETSDLPEDYSPPSIGDHGPYDIGNLFDPSKPTSDIYASIKDLSNGTKYSFLHNHVKPPQVFPSTFSHGYNRRFNETWLKVRWCVLWTLFSLTI